MKRLIVGLIVMGLVGAASAEDMTFVTGGDRLWTTAANWETNGLAARRIPTTGDDVVVDGLLNDIDSARDHLYIDSPTAEADTLTLAKAGGSLDNNQAWVTINSGAQLTLSGNLEMNQGSGDASHRKYGHLTNYGTLSAAAIPGFNNGGYTINNHGTMTFTGNINMDQSRAAVFTQHAGSLTVGDLGVAARNNSNVLPVFNMYGGTVTGTTLSSSTYGGQLNLHGGRMRFGDVNFFSGTNSLIDVQFPGILVVEGQDMTNYLQTAIDNGQITSDGVLDLSYVGGNTILHVPVDGTVFQEGVSPTTGYDQGATYIRSDTPASTNDADTDLELIVGKLVGNHLLRALLEFDLSFIQAATEIDSVSLVLNTDPSRPGGGGTNTFNVYAYGHDFDETTATWNTPGDGAPAGGGTNGTLLASATFAVTNTGLTVTFSNSDPFRTAVTDALADDNILRLIVANADETPNETAGFARFAADSFGTPSIRPKLVVSQSNWATFQEGVAPDATYTHDATFIHAGDLDGNKNNNANNSFYVGVGASDVIRGLFKFDVSSIPSSHVIDEASLALTTHTTVGNGGDNTFNLYAYGYDFDETNATWNTPGVEAPAGGSTNGTLLASATFDTTVAGQEVIFGDAAALRVAVAAALAGDGFVRMILANADESVTSNYAVFWDDEASGSAAFNSPKLEVISHEPPKGTVISVK